MGLSSLIDRQWATDPPLPPNRLDPFPTNNYHVIIVRKTLMRPDDENIPPDNGHDLPEVFEPTAANDEGRRMHFSRVDCRCCGCSGTVLLLMLLITLTAALYYFFFRP
jgi:hypothetical protein